MPLCSFVDCLHRVWHRPLFQTTNIVDQEERAMKRKYKVFDCVVLWNDEYCMWTSWKEEILVSMALEKMERDIPSCFEMAAHALRYLMVSIFVY